MVTRLASCSCGQLSIEVKGEPLGVGLCHCFECQKRTGSVFASLATFVAPFKVSGKYSEYVRVGDQGAVFSFRFCPVCGTNLFHTEKGDEQSVVIAVGAFTNPKFPKPEVSVYECRKHAWVVSPPDAVPFERDPPRK